MWTVFGTEITMVKDDYGIILPINISGVTITNLDSIRFSLKRKTSIVISKYFTNISENTVNLELTEQESSLLEVGQYTYSLDWYQNGIFMCNIIPQGKFKVIDKL